MSDPVALHEKIRELEQVISNQRHELASNARVIEQRNRQLDALGVVWCDGGCPNNMHRHHPDREVTAQQVAALVANAGRAVNWFVNNMGKVSTFKGPRSEAWDNARTEIAAATPEAFRGMIDRVAAGVTPRLERTSAERIGLADIVLVSDDRLGSPRLWQRDPAGDNAMLCFTDAAGERTWLRPGETCHRLVVTAQVIPDHLGVETPRERLKRTLADNAASWAALPAEIRNAVSTRGVFDPRPVPTAFEAFERSVKQCDACTGTGGLAVECAACGGTGIVDVGVQRGS